MQDPNKKKKYDPLIDENGDFNPAESQENSEYDFSQSPASKPQIGIDKAPVAGPAPGSALYATPPPQGKNFKDVSGIDPYSPLKNMMSAQSEMAAANQQMIQAQNTPISGLRGVLGTLVGAGLGAAMPRNPGVGAQIGGQIINAPRTNAMGLAQRRAQGAQAQFESAEKMGGMVDKAQSRFNETETNDRLRNKDFTDAANDARDDERNERELYAPTEVGNKVVQAPKYSAPAGQPPRQGTELGDVPVKASDLKVEYKTDAQGNLFMISVGKDGQPNTIRVSDDQGKPLMMAPADLDEFDVFIQKYRMANPNASPAEELEAIKEFRKSGQTSIDLRNAAISREDEEATEISNMVTGIRNTPEVQRALETGDPNAYARAYESYLARVAPQFAKYVQRVRQALENSAPSRPPQRGSSSPIETLRQQQQNPGTISPPAR